ncbi:MAG: (Fe-S)-binding protein [Acholeplasmataceae bacterium]|jgi:electron transport complex protein RnfB
MTILWPIIILGAMGILFAVALTLSDKFLKVKEDERIDVIESLLPGVNCGACGMPGCRAFAEGVVKGEVKQLSRCRPGNAQKNFNPILEYLKDHPNEDGTLIQVKL